MLVGPLFYYLCEELLADRLLPSRCPAVLRRVTRAARWTCEHCYFFLSGVWVSTDAASAAISDCVGFFWPDKTSDARVANFGEDFSFFGIMVVS